MSVSDEKKIKNPIHEAESRLDELKARSKDLEKGFESGFGLDTTTRNYREPDELQLTELRDDRPEEGGAWVDVTPNRSFSGRTHRVQFRNGLAVLPVEGKYSEYNAFWLEKDHGYSVFSVGADKRKEFEQAILSIGDGEDEGVDWVYKLFSTGPSKIIPNM